MTDDITFLDESPQPTEILNNLLSPSDISMKTRVTTAKIKGFSHKRYKELDKVRRSFKTMEERRKAGVTASQIMSQSMDYIQQLLCSLDDDNNSRTLIIDGVKGMSRMEQIIPEGQSLMAKK